MCEIIVYTVIKFIFDVAMKVLYGEMFKYKKVGITYNHSLYWTDRNQIQIRRTFRVDCQYQIWSKSIQQFPRWHMRKDSAMVEAISRRSITVDTRPVHVRLVVDKVALGQVSLLVLRSPPVGTVPVICHWRSTISTINTIVKEDT